MTELLKKGGFLRKSLHYISGSTFNKILLVLFLPLFTRKMIPEDFALYGNITIFISFITLFYFLGLPQAVYPFFHKEKSNLYKSSLIKSIYYTLFVVGIILSLLVVLEKNGLARLVLKDAMWDQLFVYVACIIFFDVFYSITLTLLNVMEKSWQYAVLGAVKNILFLILILVGYFIDRFSITAIIQYMFIASLVSALLASGIVVFKIIPALDAQERGRFSIKLLKEILRFSIPMLPGTIAFLALRISDRYMLTWFSPGSMYDVGIYTVAYRIGKSIGFATSLLSIIYYPYAMRISKEKHADENYNQVHKYDRIIGGLLAVGWLRFMKEIFAIFIDSSYNDALKFVIFGLISMFLHGALHIVNIPFYNSRRSIRIAIVATSGAIFNILLNYLFIPKYGIWAAGLSSVISYLAIYLFTLQGANRISSAKFNCLYSFSIIAVLFLVNLINTSFAELNLLIYKLILLLVAGFLFFKTGFFDQMKDLARRKVTNG